MRRPPLLVGRPAAAVMAAVMVLRVDPGDTPGSGHRHPLVELGLPHPLRPG